MYLPPIAMITPEILKTVPNMIWKAANDSGIPRERLYLYLFTDSSIAAKAIADAMKPIPVKSVSKYYRGHTETALVDNNALKRSLMELILTARTIGAAEAKELGLVSHVYPPDELMDKALELANAIASNAQVAVRQSKAAIRRGLQTDMATGAAYESEAFALCFATEDQKDAMRAFLNKEKLDGFKNR